MNFSFGLRNCYTDHRTIVHAYSLDRWGFPSNRRAARVYEPGRDFVYDRSDRGRYCAPGIEVSKEKFIKL